MGSGLFNPMHLMFIAVLGLLLFGPKRLPEMGRSLGTGLREFKSTLSGEETTGPGVTETRSMLPPAAVDEGESETSLPAEDPAGA